jgi:asparagine synthase (glutamine-hydrolysing)
MCGIVGVHSHNALAEVQTMNSTQYHRGPDGEGIYYNEKQDVAIAMRRLAIIDLEGGQQPMHSADGRYVLVYNGEIFNAPELRRELEVNGESFYTDHSDTEVLLKLLIREGVAALPKLNGMFAFCLYDTAEKTLFFARDRMGIKPLYYTRKNGCFAFSSEMKSLLTLSVVSNDINRQSLFDFLSLHYVSGQKSILNDVSRLEQGHALTYSLVSGEFKISKWSSTEYSPEYGINRKDWLVRIREELNKAVERWTLSDVPIAVSLSGGLDSSAVAAFAAQSGRSVQAYSLGFSGEGEEAWNELPLARMVANKWGLKLEEIILQPNDILDDLEKMVVSLDEPYGGGLPSWFIFKAMAGHVKVALSGTGGDEMFGNYGKWTGLEGRFFSKLMHHRTTQISEQRFRNKFFDRYYYFSDDQKRDIFMDNGMSYKDTSNWLYEKFKNSSAQSVRDSVAILDLSTQLSNEFLPMTDRFSMAHSIEARTPFLDNEFVNLISSIPAKIRMNPKDLKGMLRDAVAPLLPQELLYARKKGFVIPLGMWMRGQLLPLVEELLGRSNLKQQGLFDPNFYDIYVKPHLDGLQDNTGKLWPILMFQLWHRQLILRNCNY